MYVRSGKKDDEDETNMDQKWDKVNSSLTFRLWRITIDL